MVTHRQARKDRQKASGVPVSHAAEEAADRLHSLAIHLLRRLRREDDVSGLTAPRLSALSVIVFGGPISLKALAAAEQVRAPTMSRLVRTLESDGLVKRDVDAEDGRIVRFSATAKGAKLMTAGRTRRVLSLARSMSQLTDADRKALQRAMDILDELLPTLGN